MAANLDTYTVNNSEDVLSSFVFILAKTGLPELRFGPRKKRK